ncbi:glutathione S-transferase T2-like [Chenopodium quinoa]|uniref:glutathione S-transferase T2-like n=1 Tax=Chenopodium quinoa TaxID=63459 RepID=UPI000B7873C7|nr:glutathione S-transferase T2-like [Chenopodium quinoa]
MVLYLVIFRHNNRIPIFGNRAMSYLKKMRQMKNARMMVREMKLLLPIKTSLKCYSNHSNQLRNFVLVVQKKGVFWKRVLDAYDAARESNADEISLRTISSLKGRWMRISEAVLKWCGSYDKARKRKGSGYNEDDVIQEAHKIHENSFGRFTFYEEWIQLRKWDKFRCFLDQQTFKPSVGRPHSTLLTDESVGSESSGKRTQDEGDNSSPTTPTSVGVGDERVARAEGIKKAKSRLKGKAPLSQAFKELETFNSRLQLLGDSMNVSNEAELKRLEIQERKEARKQRKIELEQYRINWEQLSRLEQKVNREQWEDEMIVILRNNIQRFNNDA